MSLAWLPNAITLSRMVMVLPLWWLLARGEYGWALALAALAGFSDALDGVLAKRFGWQSRLGGLLDPVADKLLLAVAFLSLWWYGGHFPTWLVLLVLCRDLVILGGAAVWQLRIAPLEAAPTRLSKANTFFQIVLVLTVLVQLAFGGVPGAARDALVYAVAALTVASGVDYVVRWSRKARQHVGGERR